MRCSPLPSPGAQTEIANAAVLVFSIVMTLEDNVGDIVRKGRLASGASANGAAQAAGLTEAELKALEDTGRVSKAVHWQALAQAIGLNGAKLQRIAQGWLPNGEPFPLAAFTILNPAPGYVHQVPAKRGLLARLFGK